MAAEVEEYTCEEHLLSLDNLASKFSTNINVEEPAASLGLSDTDATSLLEIHGRNELPAPKQVSPILLFLAKFLDPLMLLLSLAGGLSFLAFGLDQSQKSNWIIGFIILSLVVVYCSITFSEEMKAAAAMNALRGMMAKSCTVVRGGEERSIDPALLVPGDLVRLRLGERVPADVRVIHTRDLKTEQSSITGESDAVTSTVVAESNEPLQSQNILFASSLVVNGEGAGIVIRTGTGTMIASIANLASAAAAKPEQTLLQREITRLVRFMVLAAILVSGAFLAIGLGRGEPIVSVIVNGLIIGIIVNVQQGLPATLTSCLSIAARRMADFNVLVRRTEIVETLGAVTVIASDKTGTLTMNKLTVENFWVDGLVLNAKAVAPFVGQLATAGAAPLISLRDWEEHSPLSRLLVAATTCNGAVFGGEDRDTAGENQPPVAAAATAVPGAVAASQVAITVGNPNPNPRAEAFPGSHSLSRMSSTSSRGTELQVHGGGPGPQPVARNSRHRISTDSGDGSVAPLRQTPSFLGISVHIPRVLSFLLHPGAHAPPRPASREARGNPLDCALLYFADSLFAANALRESLGQVFLVPFNSADKWAGVVIPRPGLPVVAEDGTSSSRHLALVKGGPEIIIARCTHRATSGSVVPVDDAFHKAFDAALLEFGGRGERVVGLAYKEVPTRSAKEYEADGSLFPKAEYTFLGLVSMVDPPRPAVPAAVAACRNAGIKVTMITGDHSVTAAAIARKVGILTLPTREEVAKTLGVPVGDVPFSDERVKALVVTGHEINNLTEEEWGAVLSKRELVFARTSPQQKLTLVTRYQARKEIIAMTGDGVNDSPALKKANVGIAMGSPGASEVAREASDIILLDDDFSHLVEAVREGRVLYDNLKKAITYTYSHLLQELMPSFLYLAFGFVRTSALPAIPLASGKVKASVEIGGVNPSPNALNGLLVLSIDLLAEQGPAISLAYEESEEGLMDRPPRNLETERLVSPQSIFYAYGVAGLSASLVCLLNYFMVFQSYGITPRMLAFSVDKGHFQPPPFKVDAEGATRTAVGKLVPDFFADGKVYNAVEQYDIHRHAMSAWYLCVITTQFWNLSNCRTRTASLFKTGFFTNRTAVYGGCSALLIMIAVIYIPPFHHHDAFQTAFLHGYFWLPQLASFIFIFGYNETVKWFFRNRPDGTVSRLLRW